MASESLTPRSFTDSELAEALRFYTERTEKGNEPFSGEFRKHFHCSRARAEMLRLSAVWAYKIKQKEKAQIEAKRKKAC